MLRITRMDGPGDATLLLIEGRLTRTELAELHSAFEACRGQGRRIVVDLAGVGFLDEPGAAALAAAARGQVDLVGASPFVKELLQEASS